MGPAIAPVIGGALAGSLGWRYANDTFCAKRYLRYNSQIYIVDIFGKSKPRRLTSGKQGATHSPAFSKQGDKVAWTEMDEDGHEADRYVNFCVVEVQLILRSH